eukprot:CAMPEP_0176261196 /NCGR_PEP_ID=MMETSP0121_2-20121125/39975_1 /TAXON_ID=160619 /ORGANISM="Kryptoperidinium foliaceum, Strain CCMP 1326" /LENGTH=219 /DNA_ID=CAMNT_0017601133 /DNA_START=3 /DNA_END=662 /DNA_ORIENTATION=-
MADSDDPPALHIVWGQLEVSDSSMKKDNVTFLVMSSSEDPCSSVQFDDVSSSQRNVSRRREPSNVSEDALADNRRSHSLHDLARRVLQRGGAWSGGSEAHFSGKCVPCHWIHSNKGCKREEECAFCHIPHTHSDSAKVGTNRRNQCRRFAIAFLRGCGPHAGYKMQRDMATVVSDRSGYLRALLFDEAQRAELQSAASAGAEGGSAPAPGEDPMFKVSL